MPAKKNLLPMEMEMEEIIHNDDFNEALVEPLAQVFAELCNSANNSQELYFHPPPPELRDQYMVMPRGNPLPYANDAVNNDEDFNFPMHNEKSDSGSEGEARFRPKFELNSHLNKKSKQLIKLAHKKSSNSNEPEKNDKKERTYKVKKKSSLTDLENNFIKNSQQNNCEEIISSQVPLSKNTVYFLPFNCNKQNPWRRTIGLRISGNELKSTTYPISTKIQKLKFAQAKKPLNYLYSYFSIKILDCEESCDISIGISRKDYPSKNFPGQMLGSIGYSSSTGAISVNGIEQLNGPLFSKNDTIGCGIVYPINYKTYADLSTDESSDGMTDVVLTSLLNVNRKSVDFVQQILQLKVAQSSDNESSNTYSDNKDAAKIITETTCDYYNENYIESRTQVEVYFTYNMQVIGKIETYIPIGGFYPTFYMNSCSPIKMSVDFNPPSS